ncbi:MAG: cytochrome c, partial [Rubrivivax sp.]
MRKKTGLLVTAATLAGIGLWGAGAVGQNAAGPFTQAQADAGHQAYTESCAMCHLPDLAGTNDAPALAGTAFMGAW